MKICLLVMLIGMIVGVSRQSSRRQTTAAQASADPIAANT